MSFGSSAVIFVALAFGHYGITISETYQKIGLILFIYSIGIQAGPGFFASFKSDGLQLIAIASLLVVSASLFTALSAYWFDVDMNLAVGLLSGALTSTPGLAASIETTGSQLASIGYGVAYPFGVIGVILFMNLVPRLIKIDIKNCEKEYEDQLKMDHPDILHKQFVVENTNIIGKTIESLQIRNMTDATISRIKHDDKVTIPEKKTILQLNDIVRAVGTNEALGKVKLLIGNETEENIELENNSEIRWMVISNKAVVNKSLAQLNLFSTYNATVTRIRRSGIDITPKPTSIIRYGDKIQLACRGNINAVSSLLGNEKSKLSEADVLPIALGVVIGVLIGIMPINLFGDIRLNLGLTGGVLITALVLSYLGKTGPVVWNISAPANQMLRQLGLFFFLASVGTQAGTTLLQTVQEFGFELFIIGISITLVPMLIALLVGRWWFKLNFITLLGTLTGGMTSTPGLTAIENITQSEAANIAYATVYPAAMVVLILCIHILGFLA